jgi:hypothetical protein
MPAYDSRTVALVLGLGAKEIDNILSRHDVPGLPPSVQGFDRRIGTDAITQLAIARELHEMVGSPWARSLPLAAALDRTGEVESSSGMVRLIIDRPRLRASLSERLSEATELVVRHARGRPRSAGGSRRGNAG